MPYPFCILCGRYIVGTDAASAYKARMKHGFLCECAEICLLAVRPENFGEISGKLNAQNGRTRCHPEKIRRGFQSPIPVFLSIAGRAYGSPGFLYSAFLFSLFLHNPFQIG